MQGVRQEHIANWINSNLKDSNWDNICLASKEVARIENQLPT